MKEDKIGLDFKRDINSLIESLIVASENYDIWWIYINNRLEYESVLNEFVDFFSMSIHAHFVAMLLSLSKILDYKPKKNISVYSLVECAKHYKLINQKIIDTCDQRLVDLKDLNMKIQIFRNNHFAHLSKKLSYDEMLCKADIRYNDFKKIIVTIREILYDISHDFDRSSTALFKYNAEKHTHTLLRKLK